MKKSLVALLLLSAILSCKKDCPKDPDPISNVHLEDGLLAYYPFNGNTNDASGNNLNGTVMGGGLSYDEHGNSNSAFNSDGIGDDRIVIPNNGTIAFDTAFSVSFNTMIRAFGRQDFIAIVDATTGKGPSFAVGTNLPGLKNLNFGVVNGSLSCDSYSSEATSTNNTTPVELQPESWYNIICIFSSGILKVYVNGDLVSTKNSAENSAHICPDTELIISGWWQNDPIPINGKIDEVRLYNRSLNTDEIAELSKGF